MYLSMYRKSVCFLKATDVLANIDAKARASTSTRDVRRYNLPPPGVKRPSRTWLKGKKNYIKSTLLNIYQFSL